MFNCLSLWNVIPRVVALEDVQLKFIEAHNLVIVFFKDHTRKIDDLEVLSFKPETLL